MKIRNKIFLVVLPLIVVTLILAETGSYNIAVNGISQLARQLLGFKAKELEKYAENQWALLVENDYAGRPDMVEAAQKAVEFYAQSILLSDTEVIFGLDQDGNVAMKTSGIDLTKGEAANLLDLLKNGSPGLMDAVMAGEKRTFQSFFFYPFQWHILIAEKSSVFYSKVNTIALHTLITLGVAITIAVILLILITNHMTNPLKRIVLAMNNIINSADLSSRVEVEYNDETGRLAYTFNTMISELDKAHGQIKRYAFDAVLAGKKEERIRQIFQKYVPKDVIEEFFASPEKMLVGANRRLAVLFSDIRSFTTISEGMNPQDLVNSLNRYFSGQVDIIMNRNGIVDKYIGDAIMAFWGAPKKYDDDATQSILSALDMIRALDSFNNFQRKNNQPEFHIGVGINYGEVTVGNIGTERKMDYTVIGDPVNLASRMEGLTKAYHAEILVSEFLYEEYKKERADKQESAAGQLRFRLLDTVAVKGKTKGVRIYTVKQELSAAEEKAWVIHEQGMRFYYNRSFREAAAKYKLVLELLPQDFIASDLYKRCVEYHSNPPPAEWDGVKIMTSK